jgi:sulfatase maturation enzyme AslB (radical SAM superfamily)
MAARERTEAESLNAESGQERKENCRKARKDHKKPLCMEDGLIWNVSFCVVCVFCGYHALCSFVRACPHENCGQLRVVRCQLSIASCHLSLVTGHRLCGHLLCPGSQAKAGDRVILASGDDDGRRKCRRCRTSISRTGNRGDKVAGRTADAAI